MLLRINQIPNRRFRTKFYDSNRLLQKLGWNPGRNLIRVDFVLGLISTRLQQTIGLIHQHPIMGLTGKRRRSTLWDHHVRNAGANHLVRWQRQAGHAKGKQTICNGLLEQQSHSSQSVAQIVPSDFALSGNLESHQRRKRRRQFDRKLIRCRTIDLPVESQSNLSGGFRDIGDRH